MFLYELEETVGKYPNWKAVLPKDAAQTGQIGLNANYLQRLQKAFNAPSSDSLKLVFYGETRAVVVESTSVYCKAKGIIMPVRLTL